MPQFDIVINNGLVFDGSRSRASVRHVGIADGKIALISNTEIPAEDAKEVIEHLAKRYLESLVYQAAIENIACEQASRMVAMKNATDNAEDIIHDLKLIYNKVRQAAITQELAEIIGGAGAV